MNDKLLSDDMINFVVIGFNLEDYQHKISDEKSQV